MKIDRKAYLNYKTFKEVYGMVYYLNTRKQRQDKKIANAFVDAYVNHLLKLKNGFKDATVFEGYSDTMKQEIALIEEVSLERLLEKDILKHDVYFNNGIKSGKDFLKKLKADIV